MKKLIALCLVAAFLFATVGCGGTPTKDTKPAGTGGAAPTKS